MTTVHARYPWLTDVTSQTPSERLAVVDRVQAKINLQLGDYMKLRQLAQEALEVKLVQKSYYTGSGRHLQNVSSIEIVTQQMPTHESWYARGDTRSIYIDTESLANILRRPDVGTPGGTKAQWHSGGLFDSSHDVGMTLYMTRKGGWLLCHCENGAYRWKLDNYSEDLRRSGARLLRSILEHKPKHKASTVAGRMERVGLKRIEELIGPAAT